MGLTQFFLELKDLFFNLLDRSQKNIVRLAAGIIQPPVFRVLTGENWASYIAPHQNQYIRGRNIGKELAVLGNRCNIKGYSLL